MRTRRLTVDPGSEAAIEDLRDDHDQLITLIAVVAKCSDDRGGAQDERSPNRFIVRLAPGERREFVDGFRDVERNPVRLVLVATSCEEYELRTQRRPSSGPVSTAPTGPGAKPPIRAPLRDDAPPVDPRSS
jgi:hypothetical protein